MPADLNLRVLIGLVDQLSAPLRGLRGRLERETQAMERALSSTANLSLVAGAAQQAADTLIAPLPFAEAIAWARSRQVVLPEDYYGQLQGLARAQAFTIAGLTRLDQLQTVTDSLTQVLESGETFATWQARVRAGEIPLELGPRQLETIFRNAIQQSYNRGRYAQQARNLATHPWYHYDAVDDSRTRPTHAAMDGYTAPADDPIWDTWTPACGHRCRCRRVALPERQAARLRGRDAERMRDPEAASMRASARALGPDKGWGYDIYREPTRGLKEAIVRLRERCAPTQMAIGPVACMGPALDVLVSSLDPRAAADELRDRLGAKPWARLERASAAATSRHGLAIEHGVALSAWTDRALGTIINATGRAMTDLAAAVPTDVELGAWLIACLDPRLWPAYPHGLAWPGVAWRGLAVRGPGAGMSDDQAGRWEDAHRPGRDVQYFGYTALMAEEGRQYAGDWQLAVYSASARDLSELSVGAEPELLVPRKTAFRYLGFFWGYRFLEEKPMKAIKPNRQFAAPKESSIDDLRRSGVSEEALAALLPAVERAARKRAAWEAAGRPGLAEMEASVQRANDLAFAGMPGYARNAVLGIFEPDQPQNATPSKTRQEAL